MVRAPSRKPSTRRSRGFRRTFAAALAPLLLPLVAEEARASEIAVLPSAEGHLGAWLALGPIPATAKGNRTARTLDTKNTSDTEESALTGRLGRQVSFVPFETDPSAVSST